MRRYLAIVPVLVFTGVLGLLIVLDGSTRASIPPLAAPRVALSALWARLEAAGEFLAQQSYLLWYLLAENRALIFYAGLSVLGALLALLTVRVTRRAYRDEARIQNYLRDLSYEKEKAQNLAKLKSEFLNQVSHELRTPLAVIMGYVDCMMDGLYGQIDSKHKEILKVISRQSTELKEMIDRILTFSRLEADKARTRVDAFSLAAMLNDLKETYAFIGQQKGIEVIWQVPQEDLVLRSDPERVKEIINNLLQNAVKFTSAGYVRLRVRHLAAMDGVAIEVEDTGIGIPRNALVSIFDPFVQVHKTSSTNSRGGIGLGLSIVKKHVEHLGGSISVKSDLGKGTTFTIVLPRTLDDRKEEARASLLAFSKRLRAVRARLRANAKRARVSTGEAHEHGTLAADSDIR
jgi:signal transduction histidine kinase